MGKVTQSQIKAIKEFGKTFFKNSKQQPFEFTDGQCEMFHSILNPDIKWVWISAPTRYGKSETLALCVLTLAFLYNLKVPIVAGTQEKARKIMEYVLQHISDHPKIYDGLLNIEFIKKAERVKIQMSKQGLRWSTGGWIYITSVDSRTISREGEGVVGEGGDVIVLEEAGLIREKAQFSKVIRMVEGDWGKLVMSGNCIERSVFEEAYHDDLYYKVKITLDQAIAEGRINPERLEQQKKQTTSKDWKRYYLVEFPKASDYGFFKPKKYDFLPLDLSYVGAVDLSLGESKKGSKIGIVVLGVDDKGMVYEVESLEENIGPDGAIRTILNLPYQFHRFGVEEIQFQKYFLRVIQEKSRLLGKYIPFIGVGQVKKKEERIESLEPFINTGQILFKGDNALWKSMEEYPDTEYLDAVDALEMAWRFARMVGVELGTTQRPQLKPEESGKHYRLLDPSKWAVEE